MFDTIYYIEVIYLAVLAAAMLLYPGQKVRLLLTISILGANTFLTSLFIRESQDPIQLLVVGHVAATLALVFFSATNWGRFVGFCFCNMFVLASLTKLGILSADEHLALSNYWTLSFVLKMAQYTSMSILLAKKWKAKWVML